MAHGIAGSRYFDGTKTLDDPAVADEAILPLYRNNQHEALVFVGLNWGIAHSGARAVATDGPSTIQPGIFFGKGFGDLPDSLS